MKNIYWRVEWHDHDILSVPAMSTGWAGIDGAPPTTHDGLSAWRTAKELIRYFEPFRASVEKATLCDFDPDDKEEACPVAIPAGLSRREAIENINEQADEILRRAHRCPDFGSRVVIFQGHEIGTGPDGEPLVRPIRVLAETTYEDLICCPNPDWLDAMEAEDIPRLLGVSEVQPPKNGKKYIIGGIGVRMPPELAVKWNCGCISDGELAQCSLHDTNSDCYISLLDATRMRCFGPYLEGSWADAA